MKWSTRCSTLSGDRGAVLTFAIGTAFVCAIAAFTVLIMAVSNARHARSTRERIKARGLAEAAQVIVRERLWATNAYCPPNPLVLDVNGDGTPDPAEGSVAVTVSDCADPTKKHQITTTRTF